LQSSLQFSDQPQITDTRFVLSCARLQRRDGLLRSQQLAVPGASSAAAGQPRDVWGRSIRIGCRAIKSLFKSWDCLSGRFGFSVQADVLPPIGTFGALRRPYTFIVAALLILLSMHFVLRNMATDIFPDIDIPVVAMLWEYKGMDAKEMADRITGPTERSVTLIDGIEHTESVFYGGASVIKIFFHQGTDIRTAMAQVLSSSNSVYRSVPLNTEVPSVGNKIAEYLGKKFAASVENVAGAIDPVNRSRQVDLVLPNPDGKLLPGT